MKHITFFHDFISPYAYLAFEQLPQLLQGLSYRVDYRPVLFAAFLKQHGQRGPAEVPPKRDWTYRQVLWLAQRHGVPMQLPAGHPFNPLPLLRLALAAGHDGCANRYVTETIYRHVWRGGASASDPQRLAELQQQLQPQRNADSEEVKAQLRANTEAALAHGVFGVPTCEVDGRLFWGFDGLAMLRDYLQGHSWFDGPDWEAVRDLPAEISR